MQHLPQLPGGCYELCELACASTIAFCSLCLLLLTQLLSSAPESGSLFFLSSPWQSKLRRISARKSNKNKALASGNNLPQSRLLVLLNRL